MMELTQKLTAPHTRTELSRTRCLPLTPCFTRTSANPNINPNPNPNPNPTTATNPNPNQGFAPNFAALTFPSCSSAVAALQYAADPRADAAAPRGLAPGARLALQVYAVALALLTLAVVLLVLVGFVLQVAQHGGGSDLDGDSAQRLYGAAEGEPVVEMDALPARE